MEDGWKYPPFELTRDPDGSGKLYGRGSTDDKGPVLGWLNVLEAHQKLGLELPVGPNGLPILTSGQLENVFRGYGGEWFGKP